MPKYRYRKGDDKQDIFAICSKSNKKKTDGRKNAVSEKKAKNIKLRSRENSNFRKNPPGHMNFD